MAKVRPMGMTGEVDDGSATKTPAKGKAKPGMKKEAPPKKAAPKGKCK